MRKFRKYQPEQLLLLPPALNDWLPKGHLASFISDLVDTLDLSTIYDSYDEAKGGQPPYHPAMMVKLLCYGYCVGVTSSRELEKATWESVPFRVLSNDQHPDHDSIAAFRQRHLKALSGLFKQVVEIAVKAKLVDLQHVAVDGTKVFANAGRGKTLSEEKVIEREEKLKRIVAKILEEAERVDKEEDELYGDRSSYLLPKEYDNAEYRLKKIQEFKEQIEQEKKEIDRKKKEEEEKNNKKGPPKGGKKGSKKTDKKSKESDSGSKTKSVKRNMTDFDSRIMRLQGGNWGQCYNSQAVVDSKNQIIVASDVTNEVNDKQQLVSMLSQVEQEAGRKPALAIADAGYYTNTALSSEDLKEIDLVVSVGKTEERKWKRGTRAFQASDKMRTKLKDPEYKAIYARRKQIVEPVFGQIKESVQEFRRFSFRGLEKVKQEWKLVCATHNILKLFRSGWKPA